MNVPPDMSGRFGSLAILVLVILLAALAAMGSWFIVDQGDRGVVLRNGAFVRVAEPGLGFKVPIIDTVSKISVRTEKQSYAEVTSYSRDIQLAKLRVAVNYNVDVAEVRKIYEAYGGRDAAVSRILTPRVYDEVKVVFGQFNARTAVEERGRLGADMEEALRKATTGTGLIVTGLQVEEIDFSKAFEQSIEDRMKAEVEVQKLLQNLEREKVQADIVRTQAKGKADAIRAQAQAEADAIRLKGEAEAAAIRARAQALQANAALIELTKAEKWNGALPTTMLPGSAVPMLQLDGRK